MYLKNISMFGFKSFANKMVFKFDEGITAIVGPNGSGKSNIADAVRWVLGEQSAKQLRGQKMNDVIFAGTENRKPLGYCQVDLTIDNSDMRMPISFSEVTISRRVYRSGEGEYYINGTACRLKDIHELFMDTGVGKEGYSIIGQGQIDKILSTSPDDRRALFDEAVGIVKFKSRKANAEKQLDEEKQNLIRINDILRELHAQEETLKGQAEVAKQYLSHKEELKKYEVNIFIHESDQINKTIHEADEKIKIINDQIENVKKENESIREKHTELNKEAIAIDSEITEINDLMTRLSVEKEKKESAIEIIKEKINSLRTNIERLQVQIETTENKKNSYIHENSSYESYYNELNDTYNEKSSILHGLESELIAFSEKISSEEYEINQIQTDIIERLNEISTVKSKILRSTTMLENIDSRNATIDSRKSNIENNIQQLEVEAKETGKKLDELYNREKTIKNSKQEIEQLLIKSEGNVRSVEKLFKDKQQLQSTLQSKLKVLDDLANHYEGYNFSIKKVMEYKKSNPTHSGVIGVVADIITVNKEYEVAIETALGGSIQNIVTEDEEAAKKMIDYLKRNQFGRATFLPLTSIKGSGNHPNLSKEQGFVGFGKDLITYESRFNHIIEYLIGRVAIVQNIDDAVKMARKYGYKFRIVTLAGEIINPGGSMTGGAYKNKGNQLLSRRGEIDRYKEELKGLEKEAAKYENELKAALKYNDDFKLKIEGLNKNAHEISLEINSVLINFKQLESDVNKYNEELKDINIEVSQLLKQKNELQSTINNLEASLEDVESINDNAENKVKEISGIISDKKLEKEALLSEVTKVKIEVSTIHEKLQNNKQNMSRVIKDIEELNLQMKQNKEEILENEKEISEKDQTIKVYQNEITSLEKSVLEAKEESQTLYSKKHHISETQETLYKERDEHNENLNLLEKELLRLSNSKEKHESNKENAINYMWDEYELTLNNALVYKDDSLGSINQIKGKISKIKNNIRALGNVNVNAIEEYKSVEERYLFLSAQRDDIVTAEAKLVKVIDELHEQMVKQFNERFKHISIKFSEVFKELFGGGKAVLKLVEDDDVLEAGIEIIAQPPGKKLSSIRLLSGGEKAFTAISLLFAIQSLKPSPFCVLDEIEAALDDANVVRFAKYLKKLTKNTQIIIITHRRGTMEVSNALYGITMQEKGISTQVSVKLLEDEIIE